jgi:hypothetical protein
LILINNHIERLITAVGVDGQDGLDGRYGHNDKRALEYIEWGERQGYNKRISLANKPKWWAITLRKSRLFSGLMMLFLMRWG